MARRGTASGSSCWNPALETGMKKKKKKGGEPSRGLLSTESKGRWRNMVSGI